MRRANFLFALITFTCVFTAVAFAQKVVRVNDPDAINPAEVTIAINPKNPNNVVAASFAIGKAPLPPYGSYNYSSWTGALPGRPFPWLIRKG